MALTILSCKTNDSEPEANTERAENWNESTHGNSSEPDYGTIFPQNKVNTFEIILGADGWQAIREDMTALAGNDFGTGGRGNGPGGAGPGNGGQPPGGGQPGGEMPGGNPGGGQGGAVSIFSRDPEYVTATVRFNGEEWQKVGFRLKGNSSLSSAWSEGIYKLPFRLHFDHYEDEYPEIKNQRLYGFKELSMSPGHNDNTLMKDKLASDLFREAGVPAAQTAFYKVYIDFGEGLKYCGVYTTVEVIDDTMTESQFGDKDGNLYKPESNLQTFIASQFEKKNNETAADYADVQQFIINLNTFDVDHFLHYLAVNNTIVNWDSYGAMAHNYYLYNHNGKLTWIPWDHNLAFNSDSGSNGNQGGAGMGRGVSLEMTEVTQVWPLLRYLADDPIYYARYKALVSQFIEGAFDPARVEGMIDKNYQLIRDYVNGSETEQTGYTYLSSPAAFETGISQLKTHINSRYEAARVFTR